MRYLRALVLLFFVVLGLVSLAVFGTRAREGPGWVTPELVAIVLALPNVKLSVYTEVTLWDLSTAGICLRKKSEK